ncbi:MAG: DUF4272 domain-containing protein [Deltaproteobacteria bacterium]
MPLSAAAQDGEARKAKTLLHLQSKGVPFTPSLPARQEEADALRRADLEIAERAIALLIVSGRGSHRDDGEARALIAEFAAKDLFSGVEGRYMADANPADKDHFNMSWRFEGLHVLLWALGFHENLGNPDSVANENDLMNALRALGPDGLRAKAKPRAQAELLDAADLMYRYDWACVDALNSGTAGPAGINCEVILEWRYALEWLTAAPAQDWDDVNMDT